MKRLPESPGKVAQAASHTGHPADPNTKTFHYANSILKPPHPLGGRWEAREEQLCCEPLGGP